MEGPPWGAAESVQATQGGTGVSFASLLTCFASSPPLLLLLPPPQISEKAIKEVPQVVRELVGLKAPWQPSDLLPVNPSDADVVEALREVSMGHVSRMQIGDKTKL